MVVAQKSKFSIYLGNTRMYQDMKKSYWWNGMKKDITDYVFRCLFCQQIKIGHQKPGGPLQTIEPLE